MDFGGGDVEFIGEGVLDYAADVAAGGAFGFYAREAVGVVFAEAVGVCKPGSAAVAVPVGGFAAVGVVNRDFSVFTLIVDVVERGAVLEHCAALGGRNGANRGETAVV